MPQMRYSNQKSRLLNQLKAPRTISLLLISGKTVADVFSQIHVHEPEHAPIMKMECKACLANSKQTKVCTPIYEGVLTSLWHTTDNENIFLATDYSMSLS